VTGSSLPRKPEPGDPSENEKKKTPRAKPFVTSMCKGGKIDGGILTGEAKGERFEKRKDGNVEEIDA